MLTKLQITLKGLNIRINTTTSKGSAEGKGGGGGGGGRSGPMIRTQDYGSTGLSLSPQIWLALISAV